MDTKHAIAARIAQSEYITSTIILACILLLISFFLQWCWMRGYIHAILRGYKK